MPSNGNGEAAAAAQPQARGSSTSWSSFLKSIASFNGDLSSMTAPPWILSSTSLVEYSSYWAEHPSAFVAPAHEADPARRAMLVLKWFLSTLKQQYSSRSEQLGSEKKPLNPFLGELFLGEWVDESGKTRLVSEQVSHHPPVTAYCIFNDEHGVRLEGYNAQKASFSRTINVRQIGHAILHLDAYDEDYLITLPSLHIEGLISASPYVELNRASYIVSSTGYTAKVDYSGRGWLSGKKNTFCASLYPSDASPKQPVYTVDGQWTDAFVIRNPKSKDVVDQWDPKATAVTELQVRPVDEQHPLESRRAWRRVADAIARGDMDATAAEKGAIENAQRALRRAERDAGRVWERRFFGRCDDAPLFERLAGGQGAAGLPPEVRGLEAEKTSGVWVFDLEKGERKEREEAESGGVKKEVWEMDGGGEGGAGEGGGEGEGEGEGEGKSENGQGSSAEGEAEEKFEDAQEGAKKEEALGEKKEEGGQK
ncbi:hypothetical protein BDY21DRAFT_327795 [Lineolata rhizophorae]|uniref:Oxysterol-binding protein n=1 Tax=Lineolata rhizophorae TaxID=578093 RepID=A0A6A6NNM1_9PEZI|nr:hypothetical protein BDY21DRAFT_327795 [Lineolata rhizophorae]